MIGTRIESRPASLLGVVLALLAAAGCLAMFFALSKPVWLCIGVLPLLLAPALWLGRPQYFAADVSPTSLMLLDRPAIEFDQVECVMAHSMARESFPILLLCGLRQILIPEQLNVSSRDLFEFLLQVVPARPKSPRDADLAAYYQRQQQAFGEQLVWHCPGRRNVPWPRRFLRARLVCTACATAGVAYMVYGGNAHRDDMMGYGCTLLLFGLIGLLITFVSSGQPAPSVKNSETASLVLCPVGLALAQSDIKGELRWDEVREVKLRDRASRLTIDAAGAVRRIELLVDGAIIPIRDIYEQPLGLIHQRILALWK